VLGPGSGRDGRVDRHVGAAQTYGLRFMDQTYGCSNLRVDQTYGLERGCVKACVFLVGCAQICGCSNLRFEFVDVLKLTAEVVNSRVDQTYGWIKLTVLKLLRGVVVLERGEVFKSLYSPFGWMCSNLRMRLMLFNSRVLKLMVDQTYEWIKSQLVWINY
jgi:hypothetical protein